MDNPEIFLDGKVDNMVQITLVKLVPVQPCICGFEFIQRVQFLWFFRIEEELLCIMRGTEF